MVKLLHHLVSKMLRPRADDEADPEHGSVVYCHKEEQDSDIKLIRTLDKGEEGMKCEECSMSHGDSFVLNGTWMQYPMTLHLYEHIDAGHQIPGRVFDTLDKEIHA